MIYLLASPSASHRFPGRLLALTTFVFLVAMTLAPRASQAQVVFDTFDDGDVSDVFVFSQTGAGIGVGPTDGVGGVDNTALSTGILPADAGAFAGIVITGGDGSTDISATSYLTFYVRPTTVQASNLPLVLEFNLQEDANGDGMYDPATEDEFQAVYSLDTGSEYTFVQIPVASFADDNSVNVGADDGFDFSRLFQVVVAIGGLQGPEFAFALDDIIFRDGLVELLDAAAEFDFFDDGDVSDVFVFSKTGAGIGVGPTDGVGGVDNTALSTGILPADAGAFAGIVITGGDGSYDASDAVYLQFFFRPTTVQASNLPLVLEFNLQEDANGDGMYDPATEDEFQAVYSASTGSGYTEVIIPVASFADDNSVNVGADDGFDFSRLFQIVVAIGGLQGPEFAFALDDIGFVNSSTVVANEPGEAALPNRNAVTAAYPNPFAGHARFNVTLERAEFVRVEVFDLLGRRVALLHEGRLAAQIPHLFEMDGRGLVSGIYLYRVTGETFAETRRVTLRH